MGRAAASSGEYELHLAAHEWSLESLRLVAQVRTARLTDYRGKELVEVALVHDESAHGFVFFIPPKGTGPLTQATLAVRFVDIADATSFDVRLPLTRLDFKGAPAPSR